MLIFGVAVGLGVLVGLGVAVLLGVGVAVFFGLNTVLKLPFSSDFLNSGTMAAFLVRTVRYALVIFADMGVYPLLFRVTGKWFRSGEKEGD